MMYRIALCVPRESFTSIIQGDPYLVAVPESMRFFHKRSDFVRYVGKKMLCPDKEAFFQQEENYGQRNQVPAISYAK
jgi:hypothetical protein